MTAVWADFSSGRPGAVALKNMGITGVIRYVGVGSASKRITASEYADYTANGVQVLLVVELGVHDAEGGYAAGVNNATGALRDARSLGIPDSVGIAAASDEHLAASQITTSLAYVQGFRDVLGAARTGAYGFAEFVDAVHSAGLAGWWWKAGNAPTLAESSWVTFWQRNNGLTTETINKVVVDLDNEVNAPITAGDEDMAVTDSLAPYGGVRASDGAPVTVGDALATAYVALSNASHDPEGKTLFDRFSAIDAALATLTAAANVPAPAVTLSAEQLSALEATVTTAVQGLNLPVSATDVSAIAQAVAALLGSKLSV